MILQKVQGQMCKYFSKNTSTRSITLFSSISDASWRRGFGKDFAQMIYRDWCRKFATGILAHNSKTVNDIVKSEAKGQNYWSRALKWGAVCFCNPNMAGDKN